MSEKHNKYRQEIQQVSCLSRLSVLFFFGLPQRPACSVRKDKLGTERSEGLGWASGGRYLGSRALSRVFCWIVTGLKGPVHV